MLKSIYSRRIPYTRREYLIACVLSYIACIVFIVVMQIIYGLIFKAIGQTDLGLVLLLPIQLIRFIALINFAFVLPVINTMKRLKDMGYNQALGFLILVPILNIILFIYQFFIESKFEEIAEI